MQISLVAAVREALRDVLGPELRAADERCFSQRPRWALRPVLITSPRATMGQNALTRSSLTWIVITAALLLSACSDAGLRQHKAPAPFADFDVLTAEQSACLFDCPVFEVQIFSDGRVLHSGPTFEHTGGPHESRIDRHGLAQIAKALRDARIDEMRDSYRTQADGCEHSFSDMSTLSFRVIRGHGYPSKSVEFYAGCLGSRVPLERINALIKAIDQVTGTEALLDQRKQAHQPDGRAAESSK